MVETNLKSVTSREEANEHVKRGGGAFFTMHPEHGDLKYIWDPSVPEEVNAAEELFNKMTKPKSEGGKGYTAFFVEKGEPAEKMSKFDKNAGKVHIKLVAPLIPG